MHIQQLVVCFLDEGVDVWYNSLKQRPIQAMNRKINVWLILTAGRELLTDIC